MICFRWMRSHTSTDTLRLSRLSDHILTNQSEFNPLFYYILLRLLKILRSDGACVPCNWYLTVDKIRKKIRLSWVLFLKKKQRYAEQTNWRKNEKKRVKMQSDYIIVSISYETAKKRKKATSDWPIEYHFFFFFVSLLRERVTVCCGKRFLFTPFTVNDGKM